MVCALQLMDCMLECKCMCFYRLKVTLHQMCTRVADYIFKNVSLWKLRLESQACPFDKNYFEPILSTLHLCILRTVSCGDRWSSYVLLALHETINPPAIHGGRARVGSSCIFSPGSATTVATAPPLLLVSTTEPLKSSWNSHVAF